MTIKIYSKTTSLARRIIFAKVEIYFLQRKIGFNLLFISFFSTSQFEFLNYLSEVQWMTEIKFIDSYSQFEHCIGMYRILSSMPQPTPSSKRKLKINCHPKFHQSLWATDSKLYCKHKEQKIPLRTERSIMGGDEVSIRGE